MADMKLQDLMLAILGLVLFWSSSFFLTPLPFLAYRYVFELFFKKDPGLDILNNVGTLKKYGVLEMDYSSLLLCYCSKTL